MKSLLKSLAFVSLSLIVFSSCHKWMPDHKKKTVVLTPHQNPTEVHIFGSETIEQSTPDAPELLGGAGTYYGDPVTMRGALKFDVGSVPKNVEIISAKLTLYSNPTPLNGQEGKANSGWDNSLLIQRITSDWVASEVKWTNQPTATSDDQVLVPHTNVSFQDVTDLDVTDLVKAMYQGSNYGFLIRLQNEQAYNFRIFCSSKYADASKHPKLVITYKR